MKISELIKDLQDAQKEYGDIEIYVKDSFSCSDNEIMDIFQDEEGRACIFTE